MYHQYHQFNSHIFQHHVLTGITHVTYLVSWAAIADASKQGKFTFLS